MLLLNDASYWEPNRGASLMYKGRFIYLGSVVLYLPVIWSLAQWMKKRPAFQARTLTFLWNFSLAVFSGIFAGAMLVDSPSMLLKLPLPESEYTPVLRLVCYVFCMSKVFEFGDTLLLVFRKKPLSFLHLYHHLTVALYGYHAQIANTPGGHLFAFVNLTVHFWMYSYYALRMWQNPPRQLARMLQAVRPLITAAQIVQMIFGFFLSSFLILSYSHAQGPDVFLILVNSWIALFMYASYCYLFVLFYMQNYSWTVRNTLVVCLVVAHLCGFVGIHLLIRIQDKRRLLSELLIATLFTVTVFFRYAMKASKGLLINALHVCAVILNPWLWWSQQVNRSKESTASGNSSATASQSSGGSMRALMECLFSLVLPTAYGYLVHNSMLIGLCVCGGVRWIFEYYLLRAFLQGPSESGGGSSTFQTK